DREARLLDLAQRAGSGLDRVSRTGEGLLAGEPCLDRAIECLAHARNRIGRELLGQLGDFLLGALDLLIDDVHRVVDLDDLRAALALAEEGVLRVALRLLHRATLFGKRAFRRTMSAAAVLDAGTRGGNLGANALGRRLARCERRAALRGFGRKLLGFGAELRAALAIALLRLRELQALDLGVMARLLLPRDFVPRLIEGGLALQARGFGARERALGGFELAAELGAACLQCLDFGLAGEEPGIGGVRRVIADGMAGELGA